MQTWVPEAPPFSKNRGPHVPSSKLSEKAKTSKTIAGVLKKPSPKTPEKHKYKKSIESAWLLKRGVIDEIDNPVILSALFSSEKKSQSY